MFSLTRAERPVRTKGFTLNFKELIGFEPFLPLELAFSEDEWKRDRVLRDGLSLGAGTS